MNGHMGFRWVVLFFGGVPASIPGAHNRGGGIHRGKGQDACAQSRSKYRFVNEVILATPSLISLSQVQIGRPIFVPALLEQKFADRCRK
jgi:hypothetical protein